MEFEFNRDKSDANKQKHGISLEEATRLWEDAYLEVTARTVHEPRWMAIGKIDGKLYACIYTRRGEAVRLISCRRASEKEVRLHYVYFKEA
ncbi:MAG: BrnT family toxin [Candidatus Omnitrophica bacterium]|nr:BrnT family toxin [Candidatus Omnitrophota bacterium]